MASRNKSSSSFLGFGLGKIDQDDLLLFNEKDYFSSPKPVTIHVKEAKKGSGKAKKPLALRRNLQAENQATPVFQTSTPEFDFSDLSASSENGNSILEVDQENDLSRLPPTGVKKSWKLKSVRNAITSWKQKLKKSTRQRNRLMNSPGLQQSPANKQSTTPTSHVKLYSPFCIDTPKQQTRRFTFDDQQQQHKPRRFQFSSPCRTKKNISEGIVSLSSLADGLDAALASKE